MNYYTVDVLTPSKVLARDVPAESLLIPTIRGQINVLGNHTHIVTKLETGVMSVFGGADDPDRHFLITVGICKVLDNKVIILSQAAEEDKDINVERAQLALKNAEEKLSKPELLTDDEYQKFYRKAQRAKIRIQMSGLSKKKS